MRAQVNTNGTGGWKLLLIPENDTEKYLLDRNLTKIENVRLSAAMNIVMKDRVGITLVVETQPATPEPLRGHDHPEPRHRR